MPGLVTTSLGDAERDVAIDVTVTSPFSVKRTAVVPLTAAKKMEVRKRKKYLEICREMLDCFSVLLLLKHMELQLMLQQGMPLTLSPRRPNGLPQPTGLLVHPKLTGIRDCHSHYGQQMQER